MTLPKCRRPVLWRFAGVMGICQALFLFAGWGMAAKFHHTIESYDHWVAFGLLLLLGGKMVWEFFAGREAEGPEKQCDPFAWKRNLLLGVATSIDALAAGVAIALVKVDILPGDVSQFFNVLVAVLIVALITFAASFTGLLLGRKGSGKMGRRAELIGGLILIAIGVKILIEHLLE